MYSGHEWDRIKTEVDRLFAVTQAVSLKVDLVEDVMVVKLVFERPAHPMNTASAFSPGPERTQPQRENKSGWTQ
jgi:hypothetical protein